MHYNINDYILLHKFTIIPNYLLHQPTFASYRQGLIGHTQVVRLLPTRLKRIGSSELSVTLLLLHYNQSEERCPSKVVTSTLLWYILYSAYMNVISYLSSLLAYIFLEKLRKHFTQIFLPDLYCVIICYRFFFPLFLPL